MEQPNLLYRRDQGPCEKTGNGVQHRLELRVSGGIMTSKSLKRVTERGGHGGEVEVKLYDAEAGKSRENACDVILKSHEIVSRQHVRGKDSQQALPCQQFDDDGEPLR